MSVDQPRARALEQALTSAFSPTHLQVENESHRHNVPPGSESHFKLTVVSDAFEGLRPVARHQRVFAAVAAVREQGIHALAIHTYTPAEWSAAGAPGIDSPPCLGGGAAPA